MDIALFQGSGAYSAISPHSNFLHLISLSSSFLFLTIMPIRPSRTEWYFWNEELSAETTGMEGFALDIASGDKWTRVPARSVYGAGHEAAGVEGDMSSPLFIHYEKTSDTSMDAKSSYSDAVSTPSFSISRSSTDTIPSSISSNEHYPESHVGRYSQQLAAFHVVPPFVPPKTLDSHRAGTWPQSSNDVGLIPSTSIDGSSTSRHLYFISPGPMANGYPDLNEDSNDHSNHQIRGQSHPQDLSLPGYYASSPEQGTLELSLSPLSSGRLSDEALLSTSDPSTLPSPPAWIDCPGYPARLSGATKPRGGYGTPGYIGGIDHYRADPRFGPCQWAGSWESLQNSWKTQPLGPCEFSSPQRLPSLLGHMQKHSKHLHGKTLSWRLKDDEVNLEHRQDDTNKTISSGPERPQSQDVQSSLGIVPTSSTTFVFDSKSSVNPASVRTSEVILPKNFGGDCNAGEQELKEGEARQ